MKLRKTAVAVVLLITLAMLDRLNVPERVALALSFEVKPAGGNVSFSGLDLLDEAELQELLPKGRSTVWWLWHSASIEEKLESNAVVANAALRSCHRNVFASPACFLIDVEERRAEFVAAVGQERWLMSPAGHFLLRVDLVDDRRRRAGLPIVSGLTDRSEASRLLFVRAAATADTLEALTPARVASIKIHDQERLIFSFRNLPFQAVFEEAPGRGEQPSLKRSVERLGAVIRQFAGRHHLIQRIDLGFSRVAVVQLHTVKAQKRTSPLASGAKRRRTEQNT